MFNCLLYIFKLLQYLHTDSVRVKYLEMKVFKIYFRECSILASKYRRILLKLSGEAMAGIKKTGIDFETIKPIAKIIKQAVDMGTEVAIVVGGGNFWRGRSSGNMNRVRADHMGMMATVINSLGLADVLEEVGLSVKVMTAVPFPQIGEHYSPQRAIHHLKKGRVVIFGYGTGNAFFSTDTAASLRAAEIGAEIIFKATNVDGVYDSDPTINQNAKKYDEVKFEEVLSKNLKVMDSSAASMCRDNNISVLVFNLSDPKNILKALQGEKIGTLAK